MQYSLFSNDKEPESELSQDELNIKLLHSIYHSIYCTIEKYIDIWSIDEFVRFKNLIVYIQDEEAEIDGTQYLDIEERLKIHRKYLCLINEKKTRMR